MSADDFDLVVWDFDGVLNANIVDGRFVWADTLGSDLGIDSKALSDFVFGSGRIQEAVRGRVDLLDVVGPWLDAQGHAISPADFLTYWWKKDAMPDAEVLAWSAALTCRQVIGTNNEDHRARYIETDMGFAAGFERIFASGRLGVAKPDHGFFQVIHDWSGVPHERTLFIDDLHANVVSAREFGWRAFHFTPQTRADLPARLGL